MYPKSFRITLAAAALCATAPLALADTGHVAPVTAYVKENVQPWLNDPVVIAAIKAQNGKHASLTGEQIVKLDKDWRAQVNTGSRPLVDGILANKLSSFLKGKKAGSNGLVTEVFVMDNKGLNVGQSDPTSDYWQGDEAKWKKTFKVGPNAVHVSEAEMDDSTQMLQSQASITITDPATGKAIGAITVGINLNEL